MASLAFFLSDYASFSAAVTAATTADGILLIDQDATLTAATTVDCPIVGLGGIITQGANSLTLNGGAASAVQLFDPSDTGDLYINAGRDSNGNSTTLNVRWFCPAPGDSSVDYQPAWQRAFDVSGQTAAVGNATITCGGGTWYMGGAVTTPDGWSQVLVDFGYSQFITTVNNTPLFIAQTVTADPSNITFRGMIQHSYSTAQTSSDTASITLAVLNATGGGDGCWNWTVESIECLNGYAGVAQHPDTVAGTCCGFWDSYFQNLTDQGLSGSLYAIAPYNGGLERLHLGRATGINRRNAGFPLIYIGNTGGLRIDQVSYDAYGTDGSTSNNVISLTGCTNYSIGTIHVESNVFGSNIPYSGMLLIQEGSWGEWEGGQFASNTVTTVGLSIVRVTGGSVCNLTGPIVTSDTTPSGSGSIYVFDVASGTINVPSYFGYLDYETAKFAGLSRDGSPTLSGQYAGDYAGLPTPLVVGQRACVTDATVNTFGTNITAGSGSHVVPAMWNGTNWVVG